VGGPRDGALDASAEVVVLAEDDVRVAVVLGEEETFVKPLPGERAVWYDTTNRSVHKPVLIDGVLHPPGCASAVGVVMVRSLLTGATTDCACLYPEGYCERDTTRVHQRSAGCVGWFPRRGH
jgi:hypothetical protein